MRFPTGRRRGCGRTDNRPRLPPRTPDGRSIDPSVLGAENQAISVFIAINVDFQLELTALVVVGNEMDAVPGIKKQGNQTGYATAINNSTHFS